MKKLDVASGQITEDYVHGYATTEQERLLRQADHWRDELILAGTTLYPGTRLLEIGCGVGAVLGILGVAFPGIILAGVDIDPTIFRPAGFMAIRDPQAFAVQSPVPLLG